MSEYVLIYYLPDKLNKNLETANSLQKQLLSESGDLEIKIYSFDEFWPIKNEPSIVYLVGYDKMKIDFGLKFDVIKNRCDNRIKLL